MHAAIAAISVVVILWLAVRGLSDPFYGLLAFMAAYEIQPGELYPPLAILHLERVLGVVLIVSFAAHHCRLRFPPVTRWLLAFYGAMLAATLFAFWRSNSVMADVAFLEIVLYHLMLVALLHKKEQIRKVVILIIGLVAWLGGSAVWDYLHGVRDFTMGIERAVGLTSSAGDADSLALTMVAAMPLMFLLMVKGNPKATRLYALVCFSIALVTVISTGARTAFFAFLLLLAMVVFRKKQNLKFLPALAVALPLFWIAIPQQYKLRYESVKSRDHDESYTDRLLSWQGGVQMFLHNPLTGVGPNNYTDANGEKYWPVQPRVYLNAHSLYFITIGELGLLGVITFGGYVFVLLRLNRSLAKRYRDRKDEDPVIAGFGGACTLTVILLLFAGYSGHDLYRTTWYTFGAISAAVSLYRPAEAEESIAAEAAPRRRLPAWSPDFGSLGPSTSAAPWDPVAEPVPWGAAMHLAENAPGEPRT